LIDCSACGYFVDWLRSCYASRWNLPTAGEVDGRYFWSADDALPYPTWSYLGSRNWHQGDGSPWPEFGELETATQRWRNGALGQILPNQVNVGDGACIGSDLVGPIISTPIGLAQGVDRRCYSVELPAELHNCSFADPSPERWQLTLASVNDDFCANCAVFNGTFILNPLSPCRWQSDPIAFACSGPVLTRRFTLQVGFGGSLVRLGLAGSGAPTTQAIWQRSLTGWVPMGPNTIPLVDQSGGCIDFPDPVTLTAVV